MTQTQEASPFAGKSVLITGGTGSLGRCLVRRLLSGVSGLPRRVIVFSRDEDKQYNMELDIRQEYAATDDVMYRSRNLLTFRIGDVRDYETVVRAVREADIIIHAAALKQVPVGEFFPWECVKTNILGAQNIIRAIMETNNKVETVLAISTDKACKPVNTYGMCKAVQERLIIEANSLCPETRFICVRYGNVIASRGSIIPLLTRQILDGGPVTITHKDMTRFFLTLDDAVNIIVDAVRDAAPGDIFVPDLSSVRMIDVVNAMIGVRNIPVEVIGIRPGERMHEILVSEEELRRTYKRGKYYVVVPLLPGLHSCLDSGFDDFPLHSELSSKDCTMPVEQVFRFLSGGGHLDFTPAVTE